jgi:hypothetical protein
MRTKYLPVLILASIATFLYAATLSRTVSHVTEPPVHELLASRITPNPARAVDGQIAITITTESIRREQCPVEIYRTFTNSLDEVVHQTYMIGGRVPASGQKVEFPFRMMLPAAKFPPGDYTYSGLAVNTCAGGHVLIVPAKRSQFTVAP